MRTIHHAVPKDHFAWTMVCVLGAALSREALVPTSLGNRQNVPLTVSMVCRPDVHENDR